MTGAQLRKWVLAFSVAAAAQLPVPQALAQSPLGMSGVSLFADLRGDTAGTRVFNSTIGKYGVSLTSSGPSNMPFLGGDARLFAPGESDGLSLIGAYTVNYFRVAVDIRRSLLGPERRRVSTEVGLGYTAALTQSLSVGVGPMIGFGDVTPSRGGARPSDADSLRSLGLSGAASLNLSENWALTGVLGYRARTDGPREESFFSVLGLGYRF
jgi:hypothetical protein